MFFDKSADVVNIVKREVVVHWQAHKSIGIAVTFGESTTIVFICIIGTAMQTEVVEYRHNVVVFEVLNESGARFQRWECQIEHVRIVESVFRNVRQSKISFVCKWFEEFVVAIPKLLAFGLDFVQVLKLCPKECSIDLCR